MDWREIPSLAALRAFEAAARNKSFSKAADELNVTHAAIAQHVRALEAEFGLVLMQRAGRGMDTTTAGARLAAELSDGFGAIAAAVRDVRRGDAARPLAVTTTFSLSETWLMPRLPEFWSAHPDIPISLTPSIESVDLRRAGFDFGIRFGGGRWPGLTAEFLLPADSIVVGSPELAKGTAPGDLSSLRRQRWLLDSNYPEADRWLMSQGLDPGALDIRILPGGNFILPAVRAGGGVAVIPRGVAMEDLKAGRLIALLESPVTSDGPAYWLVSHDGPPHPGARTFRRWILSAAA